MSGDILGIKVHFFINRLLFLSLSDLWLLYSTVGYRLSPTCRCWLLALVFSCVCFFYSVHIVLWLFAFEDWFLFIGICYSSWFRGNWNHRSHTWMLKTYFIIGSQIFILFFLGYHHDNCVQVLVTFFVPIFLRIKKTKISIIYRRTSRSKKYSRIWNAADRGSLPKRRSCACNFLVRTSSRRRRLSSFISSCHCYQRFTFFLLESNTIIQFICVTFPLMLGHWWLQESKFLKFLGFMWNPLSWVMEAAAIMAIALANGGVST